MLGTLLMNTPLRYMSILAEVAPLQNRFTMSTPFSLKPLAVSLIGTGVGVGVGLAVAVAVAVGVAVGVGVGVAQACRV